MHDTAFLRTTNQRNFALVDDTSHVHQGGVKKKLLNLHIAVDLNDVTGPNKHGNMI